MKFIPDRRAFLGAFAFISNWLGLAARSEAQPPQGKGKKGGDPYRLPSDLAAFSRLSLVLGRVTDQSVTVSALSKDKLECYYEIGTASGQYTRKTEELTLPSAKRSKRSSTN